MNLPALANKDYAFEMLRQILCAPVYEVASETELSFMRRISAQNDHQVYLKREDRQPVHSFKIRGAYNKLAKLTKAQQSKGVIAASAGNHAQGVALSAKHLAIDAVIVMPVTTPEIKAESVRALGARVELIGTSFNEANDAAKKMASQDGRTFIAPFDDEDVIAGQGTLAKELLQQQPDLDVVFVPVGGGGLLAGVACYLKQLKPEIQIIGVEAQDSACLCAAIKAGKPVDLTSVGLFADGVAVKRIGDHTFRLIQQFCDQVITVSNDEICGAIKEIFEHTRVVAEPAGALAVAGYKQMASQLKTGSKVATILSGANMNFHTLRYVSERTELSEGKEAILSVTIPEEKGSFKAFCRRLGGRVITEFNYRYSDKKQANIFVGIRLSNGVDERDKLLKKLRLHYQVEDFSDNELAKLHVRYMVGGKSNRDNEERLFRFEFPEHPGALELFLQTLGSEWNISLFHYRNHGSATGQVLAAFDVTEKEQLNFFRHLKQLDYPWQEETNNPVFHQFL